ncbi:hypothetical protein [Nocardiopsis lucentensis]|uniref:hypothetical protein n=1 Tax=Nocardiopsis lucentensis TaxID=53441 RepID=UPI00034DF5A8|nr:hypothetical protein [Nocardiopsis lucentensis]
MRAAALLSEDLAAAEDLGLWVDVVGTLTRLGRSALADDDTGRAERLYRRALEIAAERSFTRGQVRAETGLGRTAPLRGDRDGARAHLGRAVERGRALGLADEAAALLAEAAAGREGAASRTSVTASNI